MDSYHSCLYYFKTSFYNWAEFLTGYVVRGHFVYTDIFLENIIESHIEKEIGCNSCGKKNTAEEGKIKAK